MASGSGRGPLNYTTTIDAGKSASECVALLARHGASRTSIDWAGGHPHSIAFGIDTPAGMRFYTLPANVEGVRRALNRAWEARRISGSYTGEAQALRVAWRVVKDWLEAQLAMIDAQVVELEQVMLPYMVVDEVGTTVYERYIAQGHRAEIEG